MGRAWQQRREPYTGILDGSGGGAGPETVAADFVAANLERMTVANDTVLGFNGATTWWIHARINPDSVSGFQRIMFNRPGTTGFGMYLGSTNLAVEAYDGSNNLITPQVLGVVSTGSWQSCRGYWDGSTLYAVHDGTVGVTGAMTTYNPASGGTFNVGALGNSVHHFDGGLHIVSGGQTLPTSDEWDELADGIGYDNLTAGLQAKITWGWNMNEASGQRDDMVATRHLTDVNTVGSRAV